MIWAVQVPTRCTATSVCATYFRKGPPQYPMTSWYWVALLRFPEASYQVPASQGYAEASVLCVRHRCLLSSMQDLCRALTRREACTCDCCTNYFSMRMCAPFLIDLAFISTYRAASKNMVLHSAGRGACMKIAITCLAVTKIPHGVWGMIVNTAERLTTGRPAQQCLLSLCHS